MPVSGQLISGIRHRHKPLLPIPALHNLMADYIGTDNVCPYMYLWNPIDVGRLGAYTSVALVNDFNISEKG